MTRHIAPLLLVITIVWILSPLAQAHEMRPAYLAIRQSTPDTFEVLWKVPARGVDERLSLHVRFAPDSKIMAGPVGGFVSGAHVQRWHIQRPGRLDGTRITIDGLSTTLTDVLVRFERANGQTQMARLTPAAPSFRVESTPSWVDVIGTYLAMGVEHLLRGLDHLLFVLAPSFWLRGNGVYSARSPLSPQPIASPWRQPRWGWCTCRSNRSKPSLP
jgi:hypothetical protein